MSQVITIQVGQAGNKIGTLFWELLFKEHKINDGGEKEGEVAQEAGLDRYFRVKDGIYKPRCMCVDLKADSKEIIYDTTTYFHDLDEHQTYFGAGGTGKGCLGHFPNGYYEQGHLYDEVEQQLNKEIELCDNLQGFQIIHAIGRGTGGGFGGIIMEKLKRRFPDKFVSTFTVIPEFDASSGIVWQMMAALQLLCEFSDETYLYENTQLLKLAFEYKKRNKEAYGEWWNRADIDDVNQLISRSMVNITSPERFAPTNQEPENEGKLFDVRAMFREKSKRHPYIKNLPFHITATQPCYMGYGEPENIGFPWEGPGSDWHELGAHNYSRRLAMKDWTRGHCRAIFNEKNASVKDLPHVGFPCGVNDQKMLNEDEDAWFYKVFDTRGDAVQQRLLSAATIYRGEQVVPEEFSRLSEMGSRGDRFAHFYWDRKNSPDGFNGDVASSTCILQTTAVKQLFNRIRIIFNMRMADQKYYYLWKNSGFEASEQEFDRASYLMKRQSDNMSYLEGERLHNWNAMVGFWGLKMRELWKSENRGEQPDITPFVELSEEEVNKMSDEDYEEYEKREEEWNILIEEYNKEYNIQE